MFCILGKLSFRGRKFIGGLYIATKKREAPKERSLPLSSSGLYGLSRVVGYCTLG